MRIISLVPSWTETLLKAQIPLVGRTRFCLYPEPEVLGIPIVGGTKSVDWDKIMSLRPDLLILDRQENPEEFSKRGLPFWAPDVTNLESLRRALEQLSQLLSSQKLEEWSILANQIRQTPNLPAPKGPFPGIQQEIRSWTHLTHPQFRYVIWKKPWMEVTRQTYIGSVLAKFGIELRMTSSANLYPEFQMEFLSENDVLLFSSEPYPFANEIKELERMGLPSAIVDGEKFSWFGIRSLEFLRANLNL